MKCIDVREEVNMSVLQVRCGLCENLVECDSETHLTTYGGKCIIDRQDDSNYVICPKCVRHIKLAVKLGDKV